MTRLTDHRRFAAATVLVLVGLGALLCLLVTATGRAAAAPGLAAGTGVAVVDVLLTVRALDRLARHSAGAVPGRALAAATFSRFLVIASLIGIVLCLRSLNPIAVVAGFLLMPFSIVVVGVVALRRDSDPREGRLDGAAG